ncbi:MAG: hypothetical protein ACYC9X_00760 [Dehalococcoidia bacterium]
MPLGSASLNSFAADRARRQAALASAQGQAAKATEWANIANQLERAGNMIAGRPLTEPQQAERLAEAQRPVWDELARQNAEGADVERQRGEVSLGEEAGKADRWQRANDPYSAESKRAQAAYGPGLARVGVNTAGMSEAEIASNAPKLDNIALSQLKESLDEIKSQRAADEKARADRAKEQNETDKTKTIIPKAKIAAEAMKGRGEGAAKIAADAKRFGSILSAQVGMNRVTQQHQKALMEAFGREQKELDSHTILRVFDAVPGITDAEKAAVNGALGFSAAPTGTTTPPPPDTKTPPEDVLTVARRVIADPKETPARKAKAQLALDQAGVK